MTVCYLAQVKHIESCEKCPYWLSCLICEKNKELREALETWTPCQERVKKIEHSTNV